MDPSPTELSGLGFLDAVIAWASLDPELTVALKVALGATGLESPRLLALLSEDEYLVLIKGLR
eukprot:12423834-Heterocapsa_arctica.AAC.1